MSKKNDCEYTVISAGDVEDLVNDVNEYLNENKEAGHELRVEGGITWDDYQTMYHQVVVKKKYGTMQDPNNVSTVGWERW